MIVDGRKLCAKCNQLKPFGEFNLNRDPRSDGLRSRCKPCSKIDNAKYRKARAEFLKLWRRQNPEKSAAQNKRARAKARKYGMTPAERTAFKGAHGHCGCCGSNKDLAIDHDHVTGEIRGVLCRPCNMGIGQLGDSVYGLRRALRYLQAFKIRSLRPSRIRLAEEAAVAI